MSLFDQVAGVLGTQQNQAGPYQAILSWINEQGGIQALLIRFQEGGLGAIVESWISIGHNHPVSGEQVTHALGIPAIASFAEKLGIDPLTASTLIAEYLPKIVDTFSPNGEVNGRLDLLSEGLNLLKGKLFS